MQLQDLIDAAVKGLLERYKQFVINNPGASIAQHQAFINSLVEDELIIAAAINRLKTN